MSKLESYKRKRLVFNTTQNLHIKDELKLEISLTFS